MTLSHRVSGLLLRFPRFMALVLALGLCQSLMAQSVILHLKGGDQISGLIISESTNQLVISNSWVKVLSIPLSEISKREAVAVPSSPAPAVVGITNAAPVAVAKTNQVPAKAVTEAKLAASKPSVAKPAAPKGVWHGQINVGVDTLFSTKNQQDYFGQIKLTYEQAYKSNPKKYFRNTFQAGGEYQKTGGDVSANRGNVNNKSDFDIAEKSYGYVSGGAGFDEVNKINSQYQAGSGLGRHLLKSDRFVLNAESGLDYQVQNRSGASRIQSLYGRLGQDLTWNIKKNLTFTQKTDFYSNLDYFAQYHFDASANLSYGFWENLTLNLTANENYNTEVAPQVERNSFELRFTLGLTF